MCALCECVCACIVNVERVCFMSVSIVGVCVFVVCCVGVFVCVKTYLSAGIAKNPP